MKTVKTKDLSNSQLNYLVAVAATNNSSTVSLDEHGYTFINGIPCMPCTSWEQTGLLIEDNNLCLIPWPENLPHLPHLTHLTHLSHLPPTTRWTVVPQNKNDYYINIYKNNPTQPTPQRAVAMWIVQKAFGESVMLPSSLN